MPVETDFRLVGVGWLGVIRGHIRDHIVQVDGLIHLKIAVPNHIRQLDGSKNYTHAVALSLQAQHSAHCAACRKDDLAFLKVAHLRSVSVKGPGHAVAGNGLDGLVAIFHEDDVRLVFHRRIALGGNAELDLRFGKRMRVERVNDRCVRMQLHVENIGVVADRWAGSRAHRTLRMIFAGRRCVLASSHYQANNHSLEQHVADRALCLQSKRAILGGTHQSPACLAANAPMNGSLKYLP